MCLLGLGMQQVSPDRRDCLYDRDVKATNYPGLGVQPAQQPCYSCEMSLMINLVLLSLFLPTSALLPFLVPPFSLPLSMCLSAGPQPVSALQPSPQPVQFSPGSCPQVLLPVSPSQQYNMV